MVTGLINYSSNAVKEYKAVGDHEKRLMKLPNKLMEQVISGEMFDKEKICVGKSYLG